MDKHVGLNEHIKAVKPGGNQISFVLKLSEWNKFFTYQMVQLSEKNYLRLLECFMIKNDLG